MLESQIIQVAGKVLAFVGIQYALGKKASFPFGLLMGFDLITISIMVLISDLIQTAMLLKFFDFFIKHLKNLKKWCAKFFKSKRPPKRRFWEKFRRIGSLGVFLIASLPWAGGALSGSILAVSLKVPKKRAFGAIMAGCVMGTAIFLVSFAGITKIFN